MKILVTGGAGFIGSNFIYYLLENHPEDQVLCFDSLTYAGNIENLDGVMENERFRFIKGDITDKAAVEKLFRQERPDILVNFAAESHVDRSVENPGLFLTTNILGTQTLMDACLKYGIRRFHQVSTDEVYGDLPLERQDLLFTEESPIKPSSPYAVSKAGADLLALSYYRTFGLPVTITRSSNNYGRFQFPEKLIPLMTMKAMKGEKLPVYGDGKNVRDWIYVEDNCRAVDMVCRKGREGEIYNIGARCERSNMDVVRAVLKETNRQETLIKHVKDRPGHDRRYAIDPAKAERELGWKPQVNFEEGIVGTIRWYMENEPWLEDILNGNYRKH